MSNKTSFLGLSLLDTSSENSTHFKDWSRNINLEGDEDNKSDFQKIDEFAQKITKDLEERPAGVSSWEDLEDKPFGEIQEAGEFTVALDGVTEGRESCPIQQTMVNLSTGAVQEAEGSVYLYSSETPSKEELLGGQVHISEAMGHPVDLNSTLTDTEIIVGDNSIGIMVDTTLALLIIPSAGSFLWEGTIVEGAIKASIEGEAVYPGIYSGDGMVLTLTYNKTTPTVKTIDPMYLPNMTGGLVFTVNDNGIVTVSMMDD